MTMVGKLGTANISLLFSNSIADLYYINLKLSLLSNVILKIMTSNHINCVHTRDLKKNTGKIHFPDLHSRYTNSIYFVSFLFISNICSICLSGFNPVWNETIRHVIHFPELALMRIRVMDYDMLSQDDFIGQYTLPIASMETGKYMYMYMCTPYKMINY